MKTKKYELDLNGGKLEAEFNDLAENAHGSVLVRLGDTVVLATAVMSKGEKEVDYFPLSVEYEERFYASGQILGSRFIRREGRPSDEAVLSGRVVDRTIRPLFDQRMRNEVQMVLTILSLDQHDPDVLGVIAASLALGTSEIPWNGPVSAVRVGKLKGRDEFVVNPTYEIRNGAKDLPSDYELDMIVCGKGGTINMVEVGANEVSEEVLNSALEKAAEVLQKIENFQKQIIKEKEVKKIEVAKQEVPGEIKEFFENEIAPKLSNVLGEAGKKKIYALEDEWFDLLSEKYPELSERELRAPRYLFHEAINDFVHNLALKENKRVDGREFDEIRPLFAKAGGISSVLHGSGIFYRGGTHIFSALTLGAPGDSQIIDGMEIRDTKKRFMHHYNFPPFSSGEIGRVGGMNRRMIGHGALAERALLPLIPNKEEFPYTVRIVSEALSSNGSTSMGSVCASSLALFDAGVPIRKHVAGIASGLMINEKGEYKILTDIQGPEDEHGDMDFKVAGTHDGVTAVQMDVKVSGIPLAILKEAFEKAKIARGRILDVMEKEIQEHRPELSPKAPRIILIKIRPDQIGMVIGTGGKVVNEIKDKTGTEIDIEEDGTVFITGAAEGSTQAKAMIEVIVKEYKAGEHFMGKVVRVADFGAFVELDKNNDGLVHVSEMAPFRIEKVGDYVKVGMEVPVVIKAIDETGRIKLSIKDTDPKFFQKKS